MAADAIDPAATRMFRETLSAFAEIPDTEWGKAISRFRRLEIPKDGHFIRLGERPRRLAFVVSGLFRVFFATESGDDRILAFRGSGRLLSGFSSGLTDGESWYGIQALEDSVLLCTELSAADALDRTECWRRVYAEYVAMLFAEKEQRERELLSESAEGRYRIFLERYPELEGRVAQYHIASYLGITPVALSRIRKGMKT